MSDPSPFHEGERLVQSRAGVRDEMAQRAGRAIRDFMPEQHRTFFPLLPFLVSSFTLHVEESFGNCPKYIQARAPQFVAAPDTASAPRAVRAEGAVLSDEASSLISTADTFFIATAAPGAGVDVSHRGGQPGFVRISTEGGSTALTVPDFSGNNYFMTLGNIAADARAGVIFVDFETGAVVTLTCTAEIVWDGAELAAFAGARRLLRLSVVAGFAIADAVPLRWSAPEYAPQLTATGAWSPR